VAASELEVVEDVLIGVAPGGDRKRPGNGLKGVDGECRKEQKGRGPPYSDSIEERSECSSPNAMSTGEQGASETGGVRDETAVSLHGRTVYSVPDRRVRCVVIRNEASFRRKNLTTLELRESPRAFESLAGRWL
jgi:hypothetical protein